MENIYISFLITTIAGFSTLLGILIILFTKSKREKLISYSLMFSAGIMIFISLFELIPNSFNYLTSIYEIIPSLLISSIFIIFGALFTYFIDNSFKEEQNTNLYKVGIISMIALIVHNIPEGIITFLTSTKDLKLGLSLALSISLHNIPEGISIFIPLYYGSGNKKKAFLYTFIAGFSEVLGAVIAWLFLGKLVNDYFFSFIFAVTAGIMIFIATKELIPEALKYKERKQLFLMFSLGVLIMLISEIFL